MLIPKILQEIKDKLQLECENLRAMAESKPIYIGVRGFLQ
jgi:hypothetical protein